MVRMQAVYSLIRWRFASSDFSFAARFLLTRLCDVRTNRSKAFMVLYVSHASLVLDFVGPSRLILLCILIILILHLYIHLYIYERPAYSGLHT